MQVLSDLQQLVLALSPVGKTVTIIEQHGSLCCQVSEDEHRRFHP
jgi:hypothetical protein